MIQEELFYKPEDVVRYILSILPKKIKKNFYKKPMKASIDGIDYVAMMHHYSSYYGEDTATIWVGIYKGRLCINFCGSCKSRSYVGYHVNSRLVSDKLFKLSLAKKKYSLSNQDNLPVFYDISNEIGMSRSFINKYIDIVSETLDMYI